MNKRPCVVHSPIDVSVVVIGRNEGDRLRQCLQSIDQANWLGMCHEVIYVDSHSSDGSLWLAASMGARVTTIGTRRLCAASARNAGWRQARGSLVLFLDGDTILHPEFISRAVDALAAPDVVAVWGHRREIRPEQSIYTQVLDLDWVYPLGESPYFGGDALVRRDALQQAGGFDETLVAGEEPEMCWRLRQQGWRILHIDAPMTGHDLAIVSFNAYWRRAVRTGLAFAQVADRFRHTADPMWQSEVRRNALHACVMLTWALTTLILLGVAPAMSALSLAAGLFMLLRSAQRCRWKCQGHWLQAVFYAVHAHAQQIPIFLGQCLWHRLRLTRQTPQLMEYHAANAHGLSRE